MADDQGTQALGPNEWLVDEMYEQFVADPSSVSQSWQEFFADYRPNAAASLAEPTAVTPITPVEEPVAPTPAAAPAKAPAAPATATTVASDDGEVIRGAGARIVANMEASLGVPTATSFREVPAKLLEVNRRVINGYLG